MQLLEYDKRFEQHGSDFTFYDYNRPEELPSELKHAYRIVVADPPYLVSLFAYTLEFGIVNNYPFYLFGLALPFWISIKYPSLPWK